MRRRWTVAWTFAAVSTTAAHASVNLNLATTAPSYSGCADPAFDWIDTGSCSDLLSPPRSGPAFAWIVLSDGESFAGGLSTARFGIEHTALVTGWSLCTGGTETPEAAWPDSGSGNAVVFGDGCIDPPGENVRIGYFELSDASTGVLRLASDPRTGTAAYGQCTPDETCLCAGNLGMIDLVVGGSPVCTDGAGAPPASATSCEAAPIDCAIDVSWEHDGENVCGFRVIKSDEVIREVGPDVRAIVDEDIAIGVSYSYAVVAFNGCAEAPPSEEAIGTVPYLAAPSNVIASDDACDVVFVTWVDETDEEQGFRIYREGFVVGEVAANETAFTDSMAEPSVISDYRVVAFSACRPGQSSQADTGERVAIPISAALVEASQDHCRRVTLRWDDRSRSETGFRILRDDVEITLVGRDVSYYADTTAAIGQSYLYSIVATNACGDAPPSNALEGVASDGDPPEPATDCLATEDPCDAIRVSWVDHAPDESGFRVFRDGIEIALAPEDATAYDDSLVEAGRPYTYAVVATSPCGDASPSNTDEGMKLPGDPLEVPELLEPAEADSCVSEFATFRWRRVPNATHYELRVGGLCGEGTMIETADTTRVLELPFDARFEWNVTSVALCRTRGEAACRTMTTRAPRDPPQDFAIQVAGKDLFGFTWAVHARALSYLLRLTSDPPVETLTFHIAEPDTVIDLGEFMVEHNGFYAGLFGVVCDSALTDSAYADFSFDPPVVLEYFRASPGTERVRLEWKASSETEHVAYDLSRAEERSDRFERLTPDGIPGGRPSYAYDDSPVRGGRTYRYRLSERTPSGDVPIAEIQVAVPEIGSTRPVLLGAVPNPFHPNTAFRVWIPREGPVSLEVFDVAGRRVRTLVSGERPAGWVDVVWDGRDDRGEAMGSGRYLVRLRAGDGETTERVTLAR